MGGFGGLSRLTVSPLPGGRVCSLFVACVTGSVAGLLTYFGTQLGGHLYSATLFALGFRIFQNLASIRHFLMAKYLVIAKYVGHSPLHDENHACATAAAGN